MLEATTRTVPAPSSRLALVVGAWLVLGTTLALAGALARMPQLGPAFILASALGWSIVYMRRGAARRWAEGLSLRALVAGHALRLPIGGLILVEGARGGVSPLFAARAGWGDMAVGIAAIVVALGAWRRPRAVLAFAWFGLVDIAVALGTTMYLLFVAHDPIMLGAVARQPWPLLPLVAVPLVVVTHLLMIVRRGR